MALVFGFAGLRDHGGVLRFRPDLPDGWERLRFRLQVRDVVLQVDMQPARVEYRLLTGDQLDIIHDDATIHLTQAKPVELALPGHPPPSPT
jgi:alpha,alpha-trehalose phosphorylase